MSLDELTLNLFRRYEDSCVANNTRKLPVVLLTGFLGAGKTTLLKHILQNKNNLKIAAAVNDFASLNLDGLLVSRSECRDGVVQLTNGCFVCDLSREFEPRVWELLNASECDLLLVECSGVSDPILAIASLEKRYGKMTRARLDAVICVVDADAALHVAQDTAVFDILTKQLGYADLVLLNKVDLVADAAQRERVAAFVGEHAPLATLLSSSFCQVPLASVLNVEEVRGDASTLSHEQVKSLYVTTAHGDRLRSDDMRAQYRKVSAPEQSQEAYLADRALATIEIAEPVAIRLRDFQDAVRRGFTRAIIRAKGVFWLQEDPTARFVFHMSGRQRYSLLRETSWSDARSLSFIAIGQTALQAEETGEEEEEQGGFLLERLLRDAVAHAVEHTPTSQVTESLTDCFQLLNTRTDMFQVLAHDDKQGTVAFRLDGAGLFQLTHDHMMGHGVNLDEMNALFIESLNFKGDSLFVAHTSVRGSTAILFAAGGAATLASIWECLQKEGKAVLDVFLGEVCRCGTGKGHTAAFV